MASGFRGVHPSLRLSAGPAGSGAGVVSMLASWAGGAGMPTTGAASGARSLFAFWVGGISIGEGACACADAVAKAVMESPVSGSTTVRQTLSGMADFLRANGYL